jgi:hypothetical protein
MKGIFIMALAFGALLLIPGLVYAQAMPTTAKPPAISVILSYHEDNSGTFKVMADKTTEVTNIQDGDEVKQGWTIVTGVGDVAELKVNHTGTIIKISQDTNFTVDGLRTETGGQDLFSLGVGKVRTVAGKASNKDKYQIRTQSAVCGVRGSDVVVEFVEGSTSSLYTLEGTGWIQDVKTGQALEVPQGDFADALAASFKPAPIPQDVLSALQQEMNFVKLDPAEAMSLEKASDQEQQAPQQQPPQGPATPPSSSQSGFMDGVFAALHNILGFELGTLTINGLTYGEAILEPTFGTGKFKMALYLPIIYQSNMLDPGDWYHPGGNDEWSFGTDQGGDPARVVADFTRDLLLKIKYIDYGQQRDPFFLKVGNLEDITIGHGLVMRDFANDADFPTVRRMGVNIGADVGGGGFEVMVSDAAPNIVNGTVYPPDVVGGRLYARPVPGSGAALGISAIVDFNPAADYYDQLNAAYGPAAAGNPIFILPGLDLDLPFVETNAFGLVFFTDGALLLPYFSTSPTDPLFASISPGLATTAIYSPSSPIQVKNWGAAAGFLGNLIIPDFTWRLEYRLFTGTFVPELYDSGYERTRNQNVLDVLSYLTNPAAPSFNNYNMGIYGEVGFKLSKVFAVKAGYFWPWTVNTSTGAWGPDPSNPDRLVASFELEKGVIPVVNLSGAISFERTNLFYGSSLPSSLNDALFSAYTDITARLTYTVSPIMDISLLYTITPVFNADGTLYYSGSNTVPDMATSVSIITSVQL